METQIKFMANNESLVLNKNKKKKDLLIKTLKKRINDLIQENEKLKIKKEKQRKIFLINNLIGYSHGKKGDILDFIDLIMLNSEEWNKYREDLKAIIDNNDYIKIEDKFKSGDEK